MIGGIQMELAIAGIPGPPIGQLDTKKTVPLNGYIQFIPG